MARRPRAIDGNTLRRQLIEVVDNLERHLAESDLRDQVRELVAANHLLRDLGISLLPDGEDLSARQRILAYLRRFPMQVVDGDELSIVAGISEYARRVRELRVEEGWPILSGITANELRAADDDDLVSDGEAPPAMRPDQYMLVEDRQDRDAAERWNLANQIRRSRAGARDKLLRYFRANVGKRITSEELRYVANISDWPRRARELRTEDGWPIITRYTGDPTLPAGVYVLERDEQAPAHDRHIPEITRREVMQRDNWSCRWRGCGWPHGFPPQDHRFLEVHHREHHVAGGANTPENLITLCNLHHDETHRSGAFEIEE